MKKKLHNITIIGLIIGILLGGSGLLGESVGAAIGLCSLTILIVGAMIYSATHGKFDGKKKIFSIAGLCISISALFWWALGSLVWPDNAILRTVAFILALPCILLLPARKLLFSVGGVAFNIKFPGVPPIIVNILIIGLILGGIFLGIKGCVNQVSEKEYLEALGNVEVEVYDKYLNESTGKFDFAIRLKNGTAYTVTDMRFEMKVYDKTGELLVDTDFYIPEGSAFSQGEEKCFYVYVKQSDVESIETLYHANFDELEIQMWITEVEYEEYDAPLDAEYQCFSKPANP